LTLPALIEKLTSKPAKIIRAKGRGTLTVGAEADISIWDIKKEYKIDKNEFESKGRNTPFHGKKVFGKATDVIVGGKLVVQKEELLV
jgi:dihydroorotase